MTQIEIKKIIKAIKASDGAGVKLKVSEHQKRIILILLMLDEFDQKTKMIMLQDFLLIPLEE